MNTDRCFAVAIRFILIGHTETKRTQMNSQSRLHSMARTSRTPSLIGLGNAQVKSDPTAIALQEYIASFAVTGVPSGPKLPHFPLHGNNSEI